MMWMKALENRSEFCMKALELLVVENKDKLTEVSTNLAGL